MANGRGGFSRSGSPGCGPVRRHSVWLSLKSLNERKTFLPYCIKAVINLLAIVMHLNEAESWPATFFHHPHFSWATNGYAGRVND